MEIPHHRQLKQSAAAVDSAPNSRKIVLIWAGASAALSLLVSVLNLVLDNQIAGTGGLSGIGLRSILSTVQTLLTFATVLVVPFWTLGYNACILGFSRNKPVNTGTLLEGFRRFGPALRLMLLQFSLYLALMLGVFYVCCGILSATPLGAPLIDFILANEQQLLSGAVDESVSLAMVEIMKPLLIISAIACAAILIPVYFRLRFAEFSLLDGSGSALAAMLQSNRLLRRRCFRLLRLDLSFWWYYLLEEAAVVLCYGDVILPVLGIDLPLSSHVATFVFYIAGMLAQTAVLYLWHNRVQAAYAGFYNASLALHTAPVPVQNPTSME